MASTALQIQSGLLKSDGMPMNPAMQRIACDETIRFLRLTILGQVHPETRRIDSPFWDYRDTPAFALTGDALHLLEEPTQQDIKAYAHKDEVVVAPTGDDPSPETNLLPFVPRHTGPVPESYGYNSDQLDRHAATALKLAEDAATHNGVSGTVSKESMRALLAQDDVLDIQKHTVIEAVRSMQNAIAEDPANYVAARKRLVQVRGLAERFTKQYIASLIHEYDAMHDAGTAMGAVKEESMHVLEGIFSDPLLQVTNHYRERYNPDGKVFGPMQEAMRFKDLREAADAFAEMNVHRLVNAYVEVYFDNLIEVTLSHQPLSFMQRLHYPCCLEAYEDMRQQSKRRHWQSRVENSRVAGSTLNAIQNGTWQGENKPVPSRVSEHVRSAAQTWTHR